MRQESLDMDLFAVSRRYHRVPLYKKYMVLMEMELWIENQKEKILQEYAESKKESILEPITKVGVKSTIKFKSGTLKQATYNTTIIRN